MKIRIRYPRVKSIEASTAEELKRELTKLMIADFEIKVKNEDKTYNTISEIINTADVDKMVLEKIETNNGIIYPLTIERCKI